MSIRKIVLPALGAVALAGPAFAACPVAEATIEKAIASTPEFRHKANAQVVRDLRVLRDAAVVLEAYDHDGTCKQVVAVLNTLTADPERTLKAGTTDEDKAEEVRRARKPIAAKR